MKRFILIFLSTLFFAFTLQSDKPMGWYVQTIPVSKTISSIYFLDSLTGFAATNWSPEFDTAHIMKTTNGGKNWIIKDQGNYSFTAIQFVNSMTGYASGGDGRAMVWKTTNQGENWIQSIPFGSNVNSFQDLKFVNVDTGWVCSQSLLNGGIYKTTNGGFNWTRQLNESYKPKKLFFFNRDTGWACCDDTKLYRTNNGGNNWFLQGSWNFISCVYFPSRDTGYASGDSAGYMKTTNGGTNWFGLNDPVPGGSSTYSVYFINNTTGWFGSVFNKILKITDGHTVKYQNTPSFSNLSIQFFDSSLGYSGGGKMMKTTDGGGPVVGILNPNSEVVSSYKLYQNYPNPFNPTTTINYELKITNYVKLKVFDLNGKEIAVLVNERKNAGSYTVEFDAGRYSLTSGIYFYTLQTESFKETRKMILMK